MEHDALKVLMVAPTPYFSDRGCHVRIYEEARELVRRGVAVQIVTYHLGRDMPGIPTFRIPKIPWYGKLAAGPSWHKPYLDVLLLVKTYILARRWSPQLLHCHLHEGAFLGLLLKKALGIPLLFDCQGSLTGEILDHHFIKRGGIANRGFTGVERIINRGADRIVTSSSACTTELVEQWGMPPEKVTTLMDGVDVDQFAPLPGEDAKLLLGLPQDRIIVVFLGVLNRYQGIDLLLDVVRKAVDKDVPLHFLVMGYPAEQYRRRAAEEGLSGSITFTGRIDYLDAPRYLSAGDIAISPKISRTEANGKLLNYLACGLPCIAFDTPVNREILGDEAIYASFGDADDFAEKLFQVAANPARRALLAVRARERAVREHSWQVRGQQLLEIYRSTLASQRRCA